MSQPALSSGPLLAAPELPLAADAERYQPGELIGAGGMGRVVVAHDRRLGREVALKEVPADADPGLRARLLHEAAIAARLDHPGIVPVHDVGQRADGSVFIAMRVIRGRSLAELIARPEHAPGMLYRSVLAAAEAVGWAHAMGVVHRDLKPANIMVGEFGETQVVDWGLACTNDAPEVLAGEAGQPGQPGEVVGTPGYMAPEQARGQVVDARSDVWSLGAILREVALAESQTSPTGRAIAPELMAVIRKAMAPAPADRYADAKAFAVDLGDHLDGRRVAAHAYTTWELVKRVVVAWRSALIVAAVALVLLALGLIELVRSNDAARARAEADAAELRRALSQSDRHLGRALSDEALTHALDDARPEAELLAAHALVLAESPAARGILASNGASERPLRVAERPLATACDEAVIGADGNIVCRSQVTRPLRFAGRAVNVRWDAGFVTWLPVPTPADAGTTIEPCEGDGIGTVAIEERRARFAVICRGGRVFHGVIAAPSDLVAGPALADVGSVSAAAFVNESLVVGTTLGLVALVDLATGSVVRSARIGPGAVRLVDVSADGSIAGVLGERGGARLWQVATGAWLGRLPAHWSRQLRFAEDAPRDLWTLGATLVRWRLPTPSPVAWPLPDGATSLAIANTDLAVTHGSGVVLFERASGRPRWSAAWPERGVKSGAFAIDTDAVIVASASIAELRRWSRDGHALEPVRADESTRARRIGMLATARGEVVLTLPYQQRLDVLEDGVARTIADGSAFLDLGISAERDVAVVLRETPRALCLVRAAPSVALGACSDDPAAIAVAVGAAGEIVAAAHEREVVLSQPEHGAILRVLSRPGDAQAGLTEVALSPDLRFVAAGDRHGTIWLWRLADASLALRIDAHRERVSSLLFDGDHLFSGSWDRHVRVHALAGIDTLATDLVAELEARWGLTLEDIVGTRVR